MNQTVETNEERKSAYDVAIEKGEARALQNVIVAVLEQNSHPVSSAQRARLLACNDLTVLNELALRAFTADSVDALFAEL